MSKTAMEIFSPAWIEALKLNTLRSQQALFVGGTNMIPIYSPKSESEAAVIVSLMQAYGISFLMRGGAFSSMYPGPMTNSLNAQTLLVEADHAELATQLIQPFIDD